MTTSPPAHSAPAPDFKAASLPHTDSLEVASLKASSSTTNVPEGLHTPHKGRWWLLALFSVANFIDIYAASGTVLAIPDISRNLGLTLPQSIWVISSYALAFAAMMLSAGRVADIWNAKYVLIIGLLWIGAFSIGLALVETPNGMIVLRALQGVGAAMTIPAATNLIVNLFPEPALQEIAIAIFGATGAFANVLGLVLGGLLLLASYEWIFYFTSIVTIPAAVVGFFLIPDLKRSKVDDIESSNAASQVKAGKLDYLGTLSMTAAIALFVYGLTSANVDGWKSAASLSTIIIGFFMFGVFYWIETLPKNPDDALIPTSMWRIPNFALLAAIALVVPFWFFAVQSSLSERMQHLGATPLLVAARFLPMGFATLIAVAILQKTPLTVVPLRWRLLGGGVLAAVGALMISFAQEHISYWALLFPAFIIGAMGVGSLFLTLNIAIVMSVGPERAGVAGAVLNTLFQLGIAIGLAITTVLQVSYRGSAEELNWKGYRYSFLFVMAVELAAGILGFVFFKDPTVPEVAAEIEEKTRVQEVLPSL